VIYLQYGIIKFISVTALSLPANDMHKTAVGGRKKRIIVIMMQ